MECVSRAGDKPKVHLYNLLIANERTGSMFMIIAEAPETEWAANWPKLKPILSMLGIDDEE